MGLMARKKSAELHQERQEQIVQASAHLMQEKGFQGMTLQEVADQLECTKAALYYYVEDKQELLFRIHLQVMTMLLEAIEGILQSNQSATMKARAFIDTQVRLVASRPDLFTVYFHEKTHLKPEHAEVVTQMERKIVHSLETLLREGMNAGNFERVDSTVAAFAILGASSWVYRWYRSQGRLSIDEVSTTLQRIVLHGLERERS
jgi:AcrR family transcriptional regulator